MAALTPRRSPPSVLGMMGTRSRIRDRFITALAVWMVVLGVIIPSLDRELLGSEVVIEPEHNEACAHPHHDHTVCIQFGKQRWSKGSSIALRVFPPVAAELVRVDPDAPAEVLRRYPTRSRAPPPTT